MVDKTDFLTPSKGCPKDDDDSFKGFIHDEIKPATAVVVTLGIATVIATAFSYFFNLFTGILAVLLSVFIYVWYEIHGDRLTRQERIFFNEANLLQSAHGADYRLNVFEDATTPYEGGQDVRRPGPASILEALFSNDRDLSMQKFYREHYGPVWQKAERARLEREARK